MYYLNHSTRSTQVGGVGESVRCPNALGLPEADGGNICRIRGPKLKADPQSSSYIVGDFFSERQYDNEKIALPTLHIGNA